MVERTSVSTNRSTSAKKTAKTAGTKMKAAAVSAPVAIDAGMRFRMVAETAYYIAERRGFVPGNEHDDWVRAEAEVDAMLSARGQATA